MSNNIYLENKSVYEDKEIVDEYIDQSYLTPPEQTVINILNDKLPAMRMLDIAVGGGRTTLHFANRVKQYTGVDYSEEMIKSCNKRFSGHENNISFSVADMRSLSLFGNNSFDFVLISFNAISTLPHNDRQTTLKELQRVGSPGGFLYFSAHNLQYVKSKLFNLRRKISWLHPRITYWNLKKWSRLHKFNDMSVIKNISNQSYAFINDGAHNFRLMHYYISPSAQIEQLSEHFDDIRVFSMDGHEILRKDELSKNQDGYLHYLCTFRAKG